MGIKKISLMDFFGVEKIAKKLGILSKSFLSLIQKRPFFNLGPKNDWKKTLSNENREKIEEAFKEEMLELGYL